MKYDEIGARIKAEYDEACKRCGGEDCACCEIYHDREASNRLFDYDHVDGYGSYEANPFEDEEEDYNA